MLFHALVCNCMTLCQSLIHQTDFPTLQDLFATAVKSNPKSNQAKASTPQPAKAVSSSLFSDDEVQ